MYNESKLRNAMAEKGYNVARLAGEIGINEVTLYRKLKGTTEFTLREMQSICQVLEIHGAGIFFDGELA